MQPSLQDIFPACCAQLPQEFRSALLTAQKRGVDPADIPDRIRDFLNSHGGPAFLPDLARVELARHQLRQRPLPEHAIPPGFLVNPTLDLLEVAWQPLLALTAGTGTEPAPSAQRLLFWREPGTGQPREAVAADADLLALKIVAEQLDPRSVAEAGGQPVGVVDAALDQAVARGLLLAPAATLTRSFAVSSTASGLAAADQRAEVFTLQWHITHRCDLHCRHCYDRSNKEDVSLARGLDVLDQMRDFCRLHHVAGQVSFSGGNPFMHPDFEALYQAACDRNLTPAILGNPVSEKQLDDILQIAEPSFYQVSLEGLWEHNDQIRGQGNFDSVIGFLELLQRKNIYSMVMLTLTRANLDQVLPLAELLRERANLFTYNRLAMVGEGASLASPGRDEYRDFVKSYLRARRHNPIMALKDSLLNIELDKGGDSLFGGCTGFGCGAAFNFVSLLPDGQVHACRKFPSPIGDLKRQGLAEIYASEAAEAYRRGCRECEDCRLRPNCGGCLAVAYGFGLDPLREKDPACFIC